MVIKLNVPKAEKHRAWTQKKKTFRWWNEVATEPRKVTEGPDAKFGTSFAIMTAMENGYNAPGVGTIYKIWCSIRPLWASPRNQLLDGLPNQITQNNHAKLWGWSSHESTWNSFLVVNTVFLIATILQIMSIHRHLYELLIWFFESTLIHLSTCCFLSFIW